MHVRPTLLKEIIQRVLRTVPGALALMVKRSLRHASQQQHQQQLMKKHWRYSFDSYDTLKTMMIAA
jgi:hypothetical protein